MPYPLGRVQRSIMDHLVDAPASPGSDVFDLRAVARTVQARHQPAVSRAVQQLVRRGVLEWPGTDVALAIGCHAGNRCVPPPLGRACPARVVEKQITWSRYQLAPRSAGHVI